MHRSTALSAFSVVCDGDEPNLFLSVASVDIGSSDLGLDVENTVKGPRCWDEPSPDHSSSSAKRAVTAAEDNSCADCGADNHICRR